MRMVLMVTAGLMVLSAMAALGAALFLLDEPVWFLAGFEFVVLFAGAAALGRWLWVRERAGALEIACFAGSIALGTALGYLAVKGRLGDHSLMPLAVVRLAGVGVMGVAAVLAGLSGSRQGWRMFLAGMGVGVPLAVGGLAALRFSGAVSNALASLGGFGSFFVGVLALGVVGGLACLAAHLVIRSFEVASAQRAARA